MNLTFPRLGQMGRLGNQLWQIAGTVGLAQDAFLDVSLPPWPYQSLFNVPPVWFTNQPGIDAALVPTHLDERCRGYLQDYSLFQHIEDEIRDWFQPSPVAQTILSEPSHAWVYELERPILSVHVRRGDNAHDPETPAKHLYHPLRPVSYYLEGIEQFPDAKSLVFFSDDIPWCRGTFGGLNAHYYEGVPRPKEHEPDYDTAPILDWIDLFLMSACDYHVCSNSTYSWWGAFLSLDRSPVYPWPWYGPALTYIDANLMFPTGWKKVTHI